MLRLHIAALLAAATLLPCAAARAEDWEPSYTDEWTDERPSDGYDVSMDDVGGSNGSVTFDTFYSDLAPYGQWVDVPAYGRVWRPQVAAGWRPYYYGHWEWTNEGWLWVSDEPFGWAAYHYGRWTYDTFYGWVWVPGYQWAPAWVHWRYSGDVIGWAPLAPGLSIYVTTYPFYDTWWTFVPTVRFVSVPVYRIAYAPSYTRQYFYRTAPAPARPAPRGGVRGTVAAAPAWGGPAPRSIEERIGRPIRPARIVTAPSPGAARARPGEVPVYRPEVRGAPRAAQRGFTPGPGREARESFAPPPRSTRSSTGFAPGSRESRGGEGTYAPPAPRTESRSGSRDQAGFAPPRSEPSGARGAPPAPARSSEARGSGSGGGGGGYRGTPPASGGGSRGAPAPSGGSRSGGMAPSSGGRGAPAPHR
jgi:hypothetical protein